MPIAMLLHTDGRHERPGGNDTGLEERLPEVCHLAGRLPLQLNCNRVTEFVGKQGWKGL